jgi:hypothetical protein
MLAMDFEFDLEPAIDTAVETNARAEAPLAPGSLRRQS